MAVKFELAAKAPSQVGVIGVPVSEDGSLPREITLTRKQLETVGFTGKVGQTYVVPATKGVGP